MCRYDPLTLAQMRTGVIDSLSMPKAVTAVIGHEADTFLSSTVHPRLIRAGAPASLHEEPPSVAPGSSDEPH